MSWKSGGELMDEIIAAARDHIPNRHARREFYLRVIPAFLRRDCDVLYECRSADSAFDEALDIADPPEEE